MYTERLTEGHKFTSVSPASRTDASADSGYLSMRDYHRATAIIQTGALGAGTLNAKFQQAKSSGGEGVKDITGKAVTELTNADDDKMVAIELRSEEMDVDNKFDYIRLLVTAAGGAAMIFSALVIRHTPRFQPVGSAADFDEIID